MIRHYWPLTRLANREAFCDWNERARLYEITSPTVLHLPGYRFRVCTTAQWQTMPDMIYVVPGYLWDGPSGLAINDESSVVASLAHDIACTMYGHRPTLPGYFSRQLLYATIAIRQGMHPARAGYQFAVLLACQWLWSLHEHAISEVTEPDE